MNNILKLQANDGTTALWFKCEKPTRSREPAGNECQMYPHEKGQLTLTLK